MSSVEAAQAPLLMVQRSVADDPTTMPVTPEVDNVVVVTVAVPVITLQAPVPTVGVLAVKVAVVTLHKFWSTPAAEVVGGDETFMITSSVDETQAPLLIVQRRVAEEPTTNPVTPEVDKVVVVTVAVPVITLHTPVPVAGVLPAKVVVVRLHKF